MSSSENNPHITITHAYMTKSNLQEIVYDGKHPEMIQIGENEPEDNNPEKHKPADKQEISLQEEVGILLDDIEISSLLAFKTAKEVLPENIKFLKDSKHALGRAATVFISYLSATAQDFFFKDKA
ncbi:hypothetical protein DSO57_1006769 [Entomophthora muscae]|uniref:Uncharacterized protein n=1 Tax=Entomophthora muscae TaxID=34485 RepID=A0ACC2S9D5_9FUNG|nr:hypothetical protein DSO57_1006769 [Entomophthora muscae]